MAFWDQINKTKDMLRSGQYSKDISQTYGGTPYLPISSKITDAYRNYKSGDITPGYSLGINDFLTRGGSGNTGNTGNIQGASTEKIIENSVRIPSVPDPNLVDLSQFQGGGGGGGVNADAVNAQFEATRQAQQKLADQERANIEARRNALIADTEAGYGDQMNYLNTQEQAIKRNAELGTQKVQGQRQMTIEQARTDAEGAARLARDTYRDLITQGRRRARATGTGGSSGYLELGGMLDQQLMRGLGDVNQTKEKKVGSANMVADQAVGEIENTLNQVLGELANNRALSLREKDRAINEARMNAADAMLEIDKWLTKTFSDIESAKMEMKSRSAGSGANYNKQNLAAAQSQNQAALLDNYNQRMQRERQLGRYSTDVAGQMFNQLVPALYGQGMGLNNISALRGMYIQPEREPEPMKMPTPAEWELINEDENYKNLWGY